MPKLHELIAVEGDAREQSAATRKELVETFKNKRHLFSEKRVTYHSNTAGIEPRTEEQSEIQSTIAQEIAWITGIFGKAVDLGFQVDEGNTAARGDIILDTGVTLAEKVPATALLQLEKRLNDLQALIEAIPTLDPAKSFKPDATRGEGYFAAREIRRPRTQKVPKVITKAEATAVHPAQAEIYHADEEIGYAIEQEWSSLITTATKGVYLERVEDLKRAVKAARARANEVAVDTKTVQIAKKLFDHVFATPGV